MNGREVIAVPLAELTPDPDQPRKFFSEESLLGLAKSLQSGQLHPILAFRRDQRWIILDGERRFRGLQLAGIATADLVEVPEPTTRSDGLVKALIANLQHEDLTPMEKARSIGQVIRETGSSAAQVATVLGLSPASVSKHLTLLELPQAVQDRVDRREIGLSAAYAIARRKDAEEQELLAAEVADSGLTRDALAGKLKGGGCKSPPGKKRSSPTRCVARLGDGRTITLSGCGLTSLEDAISWLAELLAKARKALPRGMELNTFAALLKDEAKAKRAAGGDA